MNDELSFARYKIFESKARLACQQSLFFLGMLYKTNWQKTNDAVDKYRIFALHQINSLISSTYIPEHSEQISGDKPGLKFKDAADFCKDWRELTEYIEKNPKLPMKEIPKLREKILDLIRKSKADSIWNRLYHQLFHEFLYYLRKKIAFIWAAALLAFLFRFEAIWGLLRNEDLGIILPLILVLLPLITNRFIISILFRKNVTVAFWDIGGRALRSLIPLAVEPGKLVTRWPAKSSLLRCIFWSQAVKLAVYLIWWIFTILILQNSGGTLKTIYAFLSIGLLILTLANILDLWDFMSKAPFRFLVLFAATIFIILMLTGTSRSLITLYFVALAAISGYVWLKSCRLTNLVSLGVMVLCAVFALIGGITQNAEIWRQPEEKTIHQQPPKRVDRNEWPHESEKKYPVVVMAASGGGSRAAVFAGLTLKKMNQDPALKEVIENLQAISSVSGGSLANAAYIARLLSVHDQLDQKDHASAKRDALADLDEALSSDFLWPTLMGVFKLNKTRGKSIEEEWERGAVKLGDLRIGSLIEKWRDDRSKKSSIPPFPIPLFNTASLEGHNVVITPLAKELYTNNMLHEHAGSDENYYMDISRRFETESDDPTWVFYRNGIYGLENLLDDFDPPLSSAVRASANFPFGFPLVRIIPDPAKALYFSPAPKKKLVSLTDGGALSNSGMWSLFHLLMNNKPKLFKRGVLLIIIDASKMPVYPNFKLKFNVLAGTIRDQSTIGQNMHRLMYEQLRKEYHHRIGIVKFDIIELESYNVMTTWALDDASVAMLRDSFDIRWETKKEEIIKKWQNLRSKSSDEASQFIDRRRPPMD